MMIENDKLINYKVNIESKIKYNRFTKMKTKPYTLAPKPYLLKYCSAFEVSTLAPNIFNILYNPKQVLLM